MHPSSSSSQSASLNYARRDLLTPDEVMRMHPDHLLLLRPGEAPLFARKVRHYADAEFRSLTGPGPHLHASASPVLKHR